MTTYGAFRDGGKTSEHGEARMFAGSEDGVLQASDLLVSERAAGANMSVDVATGDLWLDDGSGYPRIGWSDAVTNVGISANATGNPRIDSIVAYWDESVVSSASSDNPNVIVIDNVDGTAAASPTAPSDSDIQTAIGAGNPFLRLADVDVANGAASITNTEIEDRRTWAQSYDMVRRDYNTNPERVISGLLVAVPGADSIATCSAGYAYVRGYYVRKDRGEDHDYGVDGTAKDTYVDISKTGVFTYTEVADAAAEPAVAANSIRLCKVDTSAATPTLVTAVTDLRNLYAYGHVTASGDLTLTNAVQTVPGTSITFTVSQASYLFACSYIWFDPTGGTNPCNTGDYLYGNLDLDTTNFCEMNEQNEANDARIQPTTSGTVALTAAAHTLLLESANASGSRGAVDAIDGSNSMAGYTYEIKPGVIGAV